jgi:hypothetical protein
MLLAAGLVASGSLLPNAAGGDSPWASLIPFRKSTATAEPVDLTEQHGPWLILAASFSGEKGEKQARALIAELRERQKLNAYLHRQTYDFTKPTFGRSINERGEPAAMRYAHAEKYDAFAVLVGNFRTVNDPALEKTLQRIKSLKPDCLDISKNKDSSQTFAALKDLYRKIGSDPERNKRGPMSSAFVTTNPLVPDDYFTAAGVDDFVMKLNKDVEFSLLNNPGKFTVRVATFRGATSINQREIEEIERADRITDKLEVAAEKAHRLTMALRKRNIEAYEFHDRNESVVTIGHFDSEGTPLANGAIDINPQMLRVIQQYRAVQTPIPGRGLMGMQPRTEAGVAFDVQPVPMAVPRRSVAADYARPRVF